MGIGFLMGLGHGANNVQSSFRDAVGDSFNIPIKRILFFYPLGVAIGYWLFGGFVYARKKNEEERNIDKLIAQNRELKEQLVELETDLYLMRGDDDY